MPSAFVPFLPTSGNAGAPAPTIGNGATDSAAAATAFAALLPEQGNSPTARPAAHSHASPNGAAATPVVTLQKDGDRVTHIRIQCSCGEVIELECAY